MILLGKVHEILIEYEPVLIIILHLLNQLKPIPGELPIKLFEEVPALVFEGLRGDSLEGGVSQGEQKDGWGQALKDLDIDLLRGLYLHKAVPPH